MRQRLRFIFLWGALLFSAPSLCCSASLLAQLAGPLPFDFFSRETQFHNASGETLYLTPITTVSGEPRPLTQAARWRQKDFPLPPNKTLTLRWDAADATLDGLLLCNAAGDCRLLAPPREELPPLETLPPAPADWLAARAAAPAVNPLLPLLLLGNLTFALALWRLWSRRRAAATAK